MLTFKDKQDTRYELAVMCNASILYNIGDRSAKHGKEHAEDRRRTKSGRRHNQGTETYIANICFPLQKKKKRIHSPQNSSRTMS